MHRKSRKNRHESPYGGRATTNTQSGTDGSHFDLSLCNLKTGYIPLWLELSKRVVELMPTDQRDVSLLTGSYARENSALVWRSTFNCCQDVGEEQKSFHDIDIAALLQ